MMFDKFGFNPQIVNALQNIDSIPTTEPNAVPGVSGRLFILAPEQKDYLEQIVDVLDHIPPSELIEMSEEEKSFYSSLLNNAERILKNCIFRTTKEKNSPDIER